MKYRFTLIAILVAWTGASAGDWSHWRGPEQNGVARDRDLPDKFSLKADDPNSNVVWRAPVGGRTTPIVQGGRVYLINKVGEGLSEQERIMCLDDKDGKVLWEYKFNIFHTDIVSDRVGWTNLAGDPETGNIYAHGTQGLLICLNKDGKLVWEHSLTEEYGRVSGYGGRVTSPIVDGDLVIIGMLNASWGDLAVGGQRFVAFGKNTGKVVWWASTGLRPKDTYFSVPVVANINGQRLLISGGGDGAVHALKVRTGEKVWSYHFGEGSVNCSPVVDGTKVYIGHGEENDGNTQGRMICLDAGKIANGEPALVWKVDGIKVKFASPIIEKGRLYICDEVGKLYCLDAATGKTLWDYNYGKNTKGSPVLADGKIYIAEVDSKFHILEPGDTSCKELYSQFFRRPAGSAAPIELNGSPAVVNGRVYFMTTRDFFCLGKKGSPKSDPIPAAAEEAKPGEAAFLQVYPSDVAIHPGDKLDLAAYAYDKNGRLLGKTAVQWSLASMLPPVFPKGMAPAPAPMGAPPPAAPPLLQATLGNAEGKETTVTINKVPANQFGRVLAKANGLTAECRVRVAARIPFPADFSKVPDGRTPGGWVNCQGKFAAVTVSGKKVLKKLAVNPSPLVARANAFITTPDASDYTIEADVMGTKVADQLPDIGIVNTRYTLQISGNKQELRILSWEAVPRVDKTLGFSWKPDTWYTMKLKVEVVADKANIQGKIWPRGQPEPKEWSIEFVDPTPNREGAAAIYGYVFGIQDGKPGTEIFYDNVKLTPNKGGEKK